MVAEVQEVSVAGLVALVSVAASVAKGSHRQRHKTCSNQCCSVLLLHWKGSRRNNRVLHQGISKRSSSKWASQTIFG